MKAGFAKVKITPPLGTRMMGFGTRDREKGCTGVHDDIFVCAVHLQQGDEAALMMGFDLCFVGRAETARFKEAVGRKTGLRPAQILLNASHSHVGPEAGRWYWGGYLPPDETYLTQLEEAVVQAAVQARDAAREVSIWVGATRSALPMNRRKRLEDGSMIMAPNPGGFAFRHLPLCLLKDADDKPVCLLFSVACHPSMVSGWEISAEYPGVAMGLIDAHLGATASLFLQGCGGDAKPCVIGDAERWRSGSWDELAQAGKIVADEVIEALDKELVQVEPRLVARLMEVEWPMEQPLSREGYEAIANDEGEGEVRRLWAKRILETLDREGKLPAAVPLTLQAIGIGEGLRLVALEGEAVAGWGQLMDEFYGEGLTFPLGYSNGDGLYLPMSDMLPEGGYEVVSYWEYGFPAQLAAGFEGILTKALQQLRAEGIE